MATVLLMCSGNSMSQGQTATASEYEVKAAFLFHFAQFVEWPTSSFNSPESPLTYCTVGEDPFGGLLDKSVGGKSAGNRPLRVQHLKEQESIEGCQVLFIGAGEKRRQTEELVQAGRHPVLTVGESEHFAEEGGIIGFCRVENKLRFEINLGTAERANLKISAKLLALAKAVIGNSRGN